jgi:hypothetical protein
MRSNTFNFLQMCSSLLLSHTLSDFTATQDGSTGLRGSVITMIFVCTEAKNLTTVLYVMSSPLVKLQGAWDDSGYPIGRRRGNLQ